jgi:outer membrane protein TolC
MEAARLINPKPSLDKRALLCLSAWALIVIAHPIAAFAAPTKTGFRFRGAQAPQVEPSPLAGELKQRLGQLRSEWRDRSVRVNLAAAIEQSLLKNPELAQAYSQIQQGQWNLIAVRRQWYPTLSAFSSGPANGLWGYGGSTSRIYQITQDTTTNITQTKEQDGGGAGLSLGWTFFDPSRGPQINAASESLRSQELLFNVAARNLVLQTQLAYFNLQEQCQLISSYEEILAATTAQANQAEALFNAGDASLADVAQIRTQQFQTLSLLISVYLAAIDASATLAQAMALPPGKLVKPDDQLAQYGQWGLALNDTIQQAQALREEIQSSLALANNSGWRASALLNRYWPRFSLLVNGSYAYNESSSTTRQLGDSLFQAQRNSNWDGAVGVGFNWSIFDGGIAAAEAQANRASQRQFADQAAVQQLQVSREVEQSYARYEASRLSLLSTREQVASARQAATAIRERFNVGYADTTSVVQTLNQVIDATNAYARSQREYNSAIASLHRSSATWPANTENILGKRIVELVQHP